MKIQKQDSIKPLTKFATYSYKSYRKIFNIDFAHKDEKSMQEFLIKKTLNPNRL